NHGTGECAVRLAQLIQDREVIGVGDRYQVAWDMPLRPVGMVIATARDHGRQLAGTVGDTQWLVDVRPPHWRELLAFLLAGLPLVVDMRGVAQRTEIEYTRDRQARRHLGMIKNERRQMPARGPPGDNDRPLDAVLARLGVEPIERGFQLVGDLRQARLR